MQGAIIRNDLQTLPLACRACSPTTGAIASRPGFRSDTLRQAKSNTTSRLSGLQPDDRRNRIQERYRAAIREFCRGDATGAYSCTQLEWRRLQGSREQARSLRVTPGRSWHTRGQSRCCPIANRCSCRLCSWTWNFLHLIDSSVCGGNYRADVLF